MMRTVLLLILLSPVISFAQETEDGKEPNTLQERFLYMKEKSNTYAEYKVIKGTVLDGVWKITMDSIKEQRVLIHQANNSIAELKKQLGTTQATSEGKDSTMAAMEHERTHITVLGIDAHKTAFISVVGFIFLGLLVLAALMFARLKYVTHSTREKTDAASQLSQEYEEYKRNALDKQQRLSRELQDERNKLQELGHS